MRKVPIRVCLPLCVRWTPIRVWLVPSGLFLPLLLVPSGLFLPLLEGLNFRLGSFPTTIADSPPFEMIQDRIKITKEGGKAPVVASKAADGAFGEPGNW